MQLWNHIPATAGDFLFTEILLLSGPCKGATFSGPSCRTVASDGTKAARSGG